METQIPWKVYHENGSLGSGGHWGIENGNQTIAIMAVGDEARLYADFTVRAVNNFEPMLTLLKELQRTIDEKHFYRDQIDEVIAKAEGK